MSDQLGRITSLEHCSVYIINMFLLARCKDKKISESSTCEVVVSLLTCKRILLTERQINRQTQNEKPNIFVKKNITNNRFLFTCFFDFDDFFQVFSSATSYQFIFRIGESGFLIGNYTILFEISVFLFAFS